MTSFEGTTNSKTVRKRTRKTVIERKGSGSGWKGSPVRITESNDCRTKWLQRN